jgi:hypothetical protein
LNRPTDRLIVVVRHPNGDRKYRCKPILFESLALIFKEEFVGYMMSEHVQLRHKGTLWSIIPKIPQISNGDVNIAFKAVIRISGITEHMKFSHKIDNKDIMIIKPKYA